MAHVDKRQQLLKKARVIPAPLKSALKKSKTAPASRTVKTSTAESLPRKSSPTRQKRYPVDEHRTADAIGNRRLPTPPPSKTKQRIDKGKAKAVPESTPKVYPSTFKVVAGSYEKLLYGLEGTFYGEDGSALETPLWKPIFIFPAHVACVKAVAASPDGGKWLATGSTDEIIKVWDLRRRKEIGGLIQHEGSITYLNFPTRSHLISASEDGTLCIFRARDWIPLRTMKGHKGRVNCVAVHPSGKVGLSVGKDRTLRMWDLMRGKGSASTKLGKEGELVRWSSTGERFVVQAGSTIDVYSIDMVLLHALTHTKRVQDVRFHRSTTGKEFLLVAAEDKKVTFYLMASSSSTSLPIAAEAIGHENRVKAIDTLAVATPHPNSNKSWTIIMCTISSDGWIRIFDLGILEAIDESDVGKNVRTLEPIAAYDTNGSRLTCCTLADGEAPVSNVTGKRKLEDEESSDEEPDEGPNGQDDRDEDSATESEDGDGSEE